MKALLSIVHNVINVFKPATEISQPTFEQRFQAQNMKLELSDSPFIAKCTRINKNNRLVYVFNYRFPSSERRHDYLTKYIENIEKYEADKKAKANLKKEVRANFVNPFKMGDIFVDSWGYEQTNVNSYQVVEVKAKSVLVREICNEILEETGPMSANVAPCKDEFKSDSKPQLKQVLFYLDNKNQPVYYIKSKFGWMRLHEEGQTYYKSWYY